ncbi:toll/interleukin-1 receptor domain-containing protein [uncultured Gimesia sp.]|uniref:toll/interleukin-1 receptor domain-containing protein n=1 Tax=uncultured Gimesia sp. TaxID=1678688 RepID=UPI0026230882|nr:toll/interleukin-1 receptor domain-containing protein [uncultured Gimesia sp.]
MSSIYISYHHLDKSLALALAEALAEQGHSISIDVETLSPGSDWRQTLSSSLKKSDAFVILWTENSESSKPVISEIGAALAYAESGDMTLIPVITGNISIPPILSHIQSIVSRDGDVEFIASQIERALSALAGRRAAEEKKQIETKERIEANAADFIKDAIEALNARETSNRFAANAWYIIGFLTLVAGVGFSISSFVTFTGSTSTSWVEPTLLAIKSLVVIGLLIACAKYSFTLGRSFMIEALKCSDRNHAISFGEFYLRAFGADVQWSELKEVFQHWNIDRASSFSDIKTNDFDLKYIEELRDLAKALSDIKGK